MVLQGFQESGDFRGSKDRRAHLGHLAMRVMLDLVAILEVRGTKVKRGMWDHWGSQAWRAPGGPWGTMERGAPKERRATLD